MELSIKGQRRTRITAGTERKIWSKNAGRYKIVQGQHLNTKHIRLEKNL